MRVLLEQKSKLQSGLADLVASGLATIELMDAASLRVAQRASDAPAAIRTLPVVGHAALLVEHQGSDAQELAAKRAQSEPLLTSLDLAAPFAMTADARDRAALWHVRKGLYTTVAGARPSGTNALLEDIVVPVPALADTCRELTRLFAAHQYQESVIFGHAKDGNVHFMLNENFDDPIPADPLPGVHRGHGGPGPGRRRIAEGRARHRPDHGPVCPAPVRRRAL